MTGVWCGRVAGCWLLVLLASSCWTLVIPSQGFSIAAFNVQIFGISKADKADVMEVLVKVVRRYDIILIQEIRDKSETAVLELLDEVNKESPKYALSISGRLGRSSSKEQYGFLYREDSGISVSGTYQDPDTDDHFQRPPFAVHFKSTQAVTSDFVLMAIHTSPSSAVSEIDALDTVHAAVQTKFQVENILIMGDFNADCSYVSKTASSKLKLRSSSYHWWIEDDIDTTVSNTDCAYDRFVMSGERFISAVKAGSADVFRFDTAYKLTKEQAEAVSDHYPIELQLDTVTTTGTTPMTTTTTAPSSAVSARTELIVASETDSGGVTTSSPSRITAKSSTVSNTTSSTTTLSTATAAKSSATSAVRRALLQHVLTQLVCVAWFTFQCIS